MAKTSRSSSYSGSVDAGDVVEIYLDPGVGDEKQKIRPCLVVEAGGSPLELIIVLGVTKYSPARPIHTFVQILDLKTAGLSKPSCVDCYQIRALDTIRITKKVGTVGPEILFDVRRRLARFLDIGEEHIA